MGCPPAVKGDQAGRADDAAFDLCHQVVIVRVERLDLALLIQQPLRWDIQRSRHHTRLQADSNEVRDILDPHRPDHDPIGHPAHSFPALQSARNTRVTGKPSTDTGMMAASQTPGR